VSHIDVLVATFHSLCVNDSDKLMTQNDDNYDKLKCRLAIKISQEQICSLGVEK